MTQASTVRGVDSDRVDGGRRPWRPTATVLVAGLLLGAVAGGFYGAGKRTSYRAVISLSVLPGSAVTSQVPGTPAGAPSQDATSFIQSQLVVLNGAPLRSQVPQQLKLRVPPDLSSTQIAQTYIVQVAANAPARAWALDAANAAG